MSNRVLADTTPLYAAVDSDDQYHEEAQLSLEILHVTRTTLVIPSVVVIEAYSLILQRLGPARALRWLDEVYGFSVGSYSTPEEFDLAATILRRYPDQSLTLVDAMPFVKSEQTGWPIWTYDHHFDILRANRWYA